MGDGRSAHTRSDDYDVDLGKNYSNPGGMDGYGYSRPYFNGWLFVVIALIP